MKCHAHTNRDAVATCSCGKGLCTECLNKFQSPICQQCAEINNQQVAAFRRKQLIITAVVAAISLMLGISIYGGDIATSLLFTWGMLGIYWGWALVKPMLFTAIFGTVVWRGTGFVLGGMLLALAIGLGMFIGPFLLAKNIFEYMRDKKIADSAKSSV